MPRRRTPVEPSEEERRLFREAVADVTPLSAPARADTARPTKGHPTKAPAGSASSPMDPSPQEPIAALATPPLGESPLAPEDAMAEFRRPGLQHGAMRRLRSGRLPVSGELDLHGLTRNQAREALLDTLHHQPTDRQCCLRIIHGRGGRNGQPAVLRPLVRDWLRQLPRVMAYCPAPAGQGGSGALLVLLARRRNEK